MRPSLYLHSLGRASTALALTLTLASPTPAAAAEDMDCTSILCLAGGFPSGCAASYSYVMDRLKKGKPPFGTCKNPDGDYEPAVSFQKTAGMYYCGAGRFPYKEEDTDSHLTGRKPVYCVTDVAKRCYSHSDDSYCTYKMVDPVPSQPVSFVMSFDVSTPPNPPMVYYVAGDFGGFTVVDDQPLTGIARPVVGDPDN